MGGGAGKQKAYVAGMPEDPVSPGSPQARGSLKPIGRPGVPEQEEEGDPMSPGGVTGGRRMSELVNLRVEKAVLDTRVKEAEEDKRSLEAHLRTALRAEVELRAQFDKELLKKEAEAKVETVKTEEEFRRVNSTLIMDTEELRRGLEKQKADRKSAVAERDAKIATLERELEDTKFKVTTTKQERLDAERRADQAFKERDEKDRLLEQLTEKARCVVCSFTSEADMRILALEALLEGERLARKRMEEEHAAALEEAEGRVKERDAEIQRLNDAIQAMKKKWLLESGRSAAEAAAELRAALKYKAKYQYEVECLREEKRQLLEEIRRLEKIALKVTGLEDELEVTKARLEAEEAENATLRRDLLEAQKELREARARIVVAEKERNELMVLRAKSKQHALKALVALLGIKTDELGFVSLKGWKDVLPELRQEKQLWLMEKKYKQALEDAEEFKVELDKVRAELAAADIPGKIREIERLAKEVEELRAALEKQTRLKEELLEKLQRLGEANLDLDEKIQRLEEQKTQLQFELDEARKKIKKLMEEAKEYQKLMAQLKKESGVLKLCSAHCRPLPLIPKGGGGC